MVNATSLYMMIRVPRPGVYIIFDETKISTFNGDNLNCDKLIKNGQFEVSHELLFNDVS